MGFCGVIQKRSFQSGKKKNAVIRLVRLSTMYRPELNWRDQYRIMMYSIFKILFFLSLSLKRFRNNCPSSNMLSTHCQSKTCPPSPGRPAFRFSESPVPLCVEESQSSKNLAGELSRGRLHFKGNWIIHGCGVTLGLVTDGNRGQTCRWMLWELKWGCFWRKNPRVLAQLRRKRLWECQSQTLPILNMSHREQKARGGKTRPTSP